MQAFEVDVVEINTRLPPVHYPFFKVDLSWCSRAVVEKPDSVEHSHLCSCCAVRLGSSNNARRECGFIESSKAVREIGFRVFRIWVGIDFSEGPARISGCPF